MNPSKIALPEAIAALLARGEPLTAAQLAAATGRTQASISLGIKALGERVHRMGAARSTRYALKQDILGLPAQHALVWNGPDPMPTQFGTLTYLHGDYVHVQSGRTQWLSQGRLPWFLSPLRPQGFLGRELARSNPNFPPDPGQWSLAQILYAVVHYVHDTVGAFFINDVLMRSRSVPTEADTLGDHYDLLAQQIGTGLPVGSSAAGEQPKFVTLSRGNQRCIVKFSPPRGTPFGERWNALLQLEHLALTVLSKRGIASAASEIIQTPTRSYLQSARFDRLPDHSMRHVVAIDALHDEFVGGPRQHWVHTSQALHAKGLITAQELLHIATIHAFGHFIGNTDMHFGNLSFFVDDVLKPKISLAPVYDMLPMMWRPSVHDGNLSDSPVREQPLPAGFEHAQSQARDWAIEFWEHATLLDIGPELQAASAESARRLKTKFANVALR